MHLTENDISVITRALRVAALQYQIDANTNHEFPRVAGSFRQESEKANALARFIEEAEEIHSG